MTDPEHPCGPSRRWRVAAPAIGIALTVAVCAALLTLNPGPARTAAIGAALTLQAVAVVVWGRHHRRAGRRFDRPAAVLSFAWFWASWSAVPEFLPVEGDQGTLERVLFGLLFAVVTTGLFWFIFRPLPTTGR